MHTIDVRVRYRNGTYFTQRVRGQQASCTVSAEAAVQALAGKLFLDFWLSYQGEYTVKGESYSLWQIQGE